MNGVTYKGKKYRVLLSNGIKAVLVDYKGKSIIVNVSELFN